MIHVAFDPGKSVAGYGAMDLDGNVLSYGQGHPRTLFREAYQQFKDLDVLWTCEEVFVGPNPLSAVELAKAQGALKGHLQAAGMLRGDNWWWEPRSSTWRSMINFQMRQPAPTKKNPRATRSTSKTEFMEMACARASALVGRTFDKSQEHAADAVCIASAARQRWVLQQKKPPQLSLLSTT